MVTSIDTARYIHSKTGSVDEKKLSMLVYLVQAWSLGWYGKKMFDTPIYTNESGPVIRELDTDTVNNFSSSDTACLSHEQRRVIDAVIDFYGDMAVQQLHDLLSVDPSWRTGLETVSATDMRRYYALLELDNDNVPARPVADSACTESDRESMEKQVQRWESALDVLAYR